MTSEQHVPSGPKPCIIREFERLEYQQAYELQLRCVADKSAHPERPDQVLMLEHPSVYTLGRQGRRDSLLVSEAWLQAQDISVRHVERGGDITYHGPGQLVIYTIFDLKRARMAVTELVYGLEQVMIESAAAFGVAAHRKDRHRGVWVGEVKIGSVGLAVRRGISFHGLAFNINCSLEPFTWINPCGLQGVRMTSLEQAARRSIAMPDVRRDCKKQLQRIFQLEWQEEETKPMAPQPESRTQKPRWLRKRLPSGPAFGRVQNLLAAHGLHTVCQEAKCPNQFECFSRRTATFMIMGSKCTRDCRFCAVAQGPEAGPDPEEARRVAQAAQELGLGYAVVTSVTRDDLPDGGADCFARVIQALKTNLPDIKVEVLVPDFQGDPAALEAVFRAGPDVFNHNLETVPRLYSLARPQADYQRSLHVLSRASTIEPNIPVKSGLMLGLGETDSEIRQVMHDLLQSGCSILTLGQYLQPTAEHLPVVRYLPPEAFEELQKTAYDLGFRCVVSGPFVRSSYQAESLLKQFNEHTEAHAASYTAPNSDFVSALRL